MFIGPFKTLFCSKDGCTITCSESNHLATLSDACTSPCRGITIPCNGPTNVGSVSRRSIGVPCFSPNAVPLRRIDDFLSSPRFKIIKIRMSSIHTGIEIDDCGTITIPFCKGIVDIKFHVSINIDNSTMPCIGCSHNVCCFMHHKRRVGRVSTPFRWEVEELKFSV